nr:transposase [Pandoraea oxalativorans]
MWRITVRGKRARTSSNRAFSERERAVCRLAHVAHLQVLDGDHGVVFADCARCGHISADNRKTQARFACLTCGHTANADHVGAIHVLAEGRAVSACGEKVRSGRSKKREPTEAPRAPAA